MNSQKLTVVFLSLVCIVATAGAQDANKKEDTMQDCPMHREHATGHSHHASVLSHGDEAMGFSHEKTTLHFRLAPDGGAIEVTVNDANDKTSLEAIRSEAGLTTIESGAVGIRDLQFALAMSACCA